LRTVQRERDLAIATIAKKEEPEKSSWGGCLCFCRAM
jgi:hypothetical protein